MAYQTALYTGDGLTKVFTVPFTYLDRGHVKVRVGGVLTTAFTFLNASQIEMTVAPSAGSEVKIFRVTPADERMVSFKGVPALDPSLLDRSNDQLLFGLQEEIATRTSMDLELARSIAELPLGLPAGAVTDYSLLLKVADLQVKDGLWVDARSYPSLNEAVTAVGNARKTIVIPADVSVTGNLIIPSNIDLLTLNGAKINLGSYTLNYAGDTSRWPVAQIFNGTGAVSGLRVARPEWWKQNVAGTTDMAVAIRSADAAVTEGGAVLFKGEEYLINSELRISVAWHGVAGKTKITVGAGFTRTQTYGDPFSYSFIWNKDFSTAGYDSATANYVRLDGIHFHLKNNQHIGTIITLGNVRGGSITNCKFDTSGVTAGINNLNLHASVKNMVIAGNEFRNETGAAIGGNIWVRNVTTDAANAGSATENVTIRNNYFVKNSGDESIAVTAVFSLVKNVRVENNRFAASGATQGALIVAGLDPNASYTATAEARDIQFNNNHVVTSATLNEVMRSGVAGDNSDKLSDVLFQGNTIMYDAPSSGTRAGIRQVAGRNVKAVGNNIYNVGTTYAVQRGLYLMDEARDNTIKDVLGAAVPMAVAIDGGTLAVGNVIDVGGSGVQNCATAINNIVKAVKPFTASTTSQYDAIGNRFEIAGTGVAVNAVIYNSLGGAVNPSGRLIGNTIICNDATNHRPVLVQGTGRVEMVDNRITGAGKYTYGPLKYARGNEYYGTRFDDAHTSSSIDGDLSSALPVGHFVRNIGTMTVDGSGNLLTGWIKLTSGAWQAVYQKTTSP